MASRCLKLFAANQPVTSTGVRISLDVGLWLVAILAVIGGIAGFVFGNKKLDGK